MLNPGVVVILQNRSAAPLPLAVTLTHQATGTARRWDLLLRAAGSQEIGQLQGWIGESGDSITRSNSRTSTIVPGMGSIQ